MDTLTQIEQATMQAITMLEAEGNHEFMVYIEDRNQPGSGQDKVWFMVRDKDGAVIEDISMSTHAEINNVPINGGNLVVPH